MKTLYAPRFFKSPIDDANEDLVVPPQKKKSLDIYNIYH